MAVFKKIRSNMSFGVIGMLVGLMTFFAAIVCLVSSVTYVDAYQKEYATVTYHMADSATVFVEGDQLSYYVAHKDDLPQEYETSRVQLETCAKKLNVSLIYVIQVDQSDYGRFVSVFNVVNNAVDNTSYTPWAAGYERNTTNDEYRGKYKALYEGKSPYETVFRFHTTDGQHPHITTLVPVYNNNGEVAGLLCMQRPINEMASAMMPYIVTIIVSAAALAIVLSVLSVLAVNHFIIKPLGKVEEEASRFAKESTVGEPLDNISHYDVFLNLANSIHTMEKDTVQYIEHITSITAEKERLGAELSIASSIQRDSLPEVENAFPGREDFDVYASMNPAKEVGGDFYNFFLIDEDHLALVIADVSGKGVPAALFMMVCNILISERARVGGTPKEILAHVNENIVAHNKSGMFLTAWLGILELSSGRLLSANAGHEDPVIYHKEKGHFQSCPEEHGVVLGALSGATFEDQETVLEKGDKLFLFTDGLAEAMDSHRHMYSAERAIRTLNHYKEESPKELLRLVEEDIARFVGEEQQFDDLTMLCVERK